MLQKSKSNISQRDRGRHQTLTIQQGILSSPLGMEQKALLLCQSIWRRLYHPLRGK